MRIDRLALGADQSARVEAPPLLKDERIVTPQIETGAGSLGGCHGHRHSRAELSFGIRGHPRQCYFRALSWLLHERIGPDLPLAQRQQIFWLLHIRCLRDLDDCKHRRFPRFAIRKHIEPILTDRHRSHDSQAKGDLPHLVECDVGFRDLRVGRSGFAHIHRDPCSSHDLV